MTQQLQELAIIGGGLTGPALALCLKKYGISSTIYELHESHHVLGGPIVLSSNALRALDHIGVYSQIKKLGYNYESMTLENSFGKVLGTFSTGNIKLFQYSALRMMRPDLRAELLKKCESEGIRIVFGKKLIDVKEENNGVTLSFADGENENATMVVGTDGPYSIVRKAIAPLVQTGYSGLHIIYGTMPRAVFVKCLQGRKQTLQEPSLVVGQEGSMAVIPLDPKADHISFFFSTTLANRSREEWARLDEDKEALRQLLTERYCNGHWSKDVEILIRETRAENFISWPTTITPELDSWSSSSGRIVLAGDSAHSIPPSAAQGAGMAFEDAETLAYILSQYQVQKKTTTVQESKFKETLNTWQQHRKERVKAVLAFTNLTMKLRTPSPNRIIQWLKELFIIVFFKLKGPEGYRWLYSYDGTSAEIRKALL